MRFLPILLALCLLIPVGYAISYDGEAVLADGGVTAETLSVGIYTQEDGDYIPSLVGISPLTVIKNRNTYSLSATNEVVSTGYYLKVIGDADTCTLDCDTDVVTTISNPTVTVSVSNSSVFPRTVSIGTYYPITITVTASYSGNTYPQLDLTPVFTASSVSNGEFQQSSTTALRLKITDASSVLEVIEDSNEELIDAGDYSVSTNTSTNHGNNYPAVNLANEDNNRGGIADSDGNIDLNLTIPKGYAFVLYLRTTGSNTFQLTMYKGTEVVISGTVTFNAGGYLASGYYLSSKSYDGSSSGYFYSSINNVNTYDAWMSGSTEDYSIVITTQDGQSASQTLKMDIVFKKD